MGDVNKPPGEFLGFPDLYGFDSVLDWRMVSGSRGRACLLHSPWNNRPSGEKVLTPLSNRQVKPDTPRSREAYEPYSDLVKNMIEVEREEVRASP
jgi:hypothetical protein